MKNLVYSSAFLFLGMFLVMGCGKVDRVTPEQVTAIQNASDKVPAAVVNNAQNLNTGTLQTKLNALVASGKLTPAQAAALADSKNQAMITNLVQLAKGGSSQARSQAAAGLLNAAAAKGATGDTLTQLLELLNTIAPIIAMIDPSLAPFIQIAITILPIILTLFGGI